MAVILFISGCGQAPDSKTAKLDAGGPRNDKQMKIDLPKGVISDLIVGKKIMATGNSSQDGALTASRIIIGGPQGFGMFGGHVSSTVATGFERQQNRKQSGGGQWQGRQGGQQRAGNDSRPRTVGNRMNSASGEIVKIDQNSIILKADDGGSKIVFLSSSTEIFLATTSTPPVIVPPTSADQVKQ